MTLDIYLILTTLLNGLSIGMILVLVALGLVLVFGLQRIPNFAHGNFYALGAYIALTMSAWTGNFWVSLLIAGVLVGCTGIIIEPLLLRRLYARPFLDIFLCMFGVLWVIFDIIELIWGSFGKPFDIPMELRGTLLIGSLTYPKYRMFQIVFSIAIVFAVWLFLKKTNIGLIIRAGVQDSGMVRALGINIYKIFTFSFCLAIAVAGVAGGITGTLYHVYLGMGNDIILKAFLVLVLGGIGSFRGAVIAGIALGEASAFTAVIWPPASDVIMFIVMAAILIARPGGILGEGEAV